MAEEKKKILVTDDDAAIRTLIVSVLSDEYDVMESGDGLEALKLARDWRPDLVITDLMMPGMHGYELCGILKGPEGVRGVKIIVASSKSFSTDMAQARGAGADAYIVKPFTVSSFLSKVRDVLSFPGRQTASRARDEHGAPEASAAAASPISGLGCLPVYVRFWGTRGSCPTSGELTARYGGNTACTEVRIGGVPVIIDCGTGVRELGCSLVKEFAGKSISGHIFVGHTHWDHIQGFPFFAPLYDTRNTFNVYSVHGAHGSLRGLFSDAMALDYFPVPLSSLGSSLNFVELKGPVDIGVAKVSFRHLNHPGVCIGFSIEAQGRKITYLSDHETFRRLGGDNEVSRRQDLDLTDFARGSDLLIREAQYTEEEYTARRGWGHSTYDDVVRFGIDACVRRLAIYHHDPAHEDGVLDSNLEYCRGIVKASGSELDCFAARDGMRIDL